MNPLKLLLKCIYNVIIGGILLLIINYFSSMFGFQFALNAFTALIVGFLRVPGIILLVICRYVLGIS